MVRRAADAVAVIAVLVIPVARVAVRVRAVTGIIGVRARAVASFPMHAAAVAACAAGQRFGAGAGHIRI